MVVLVMTKLLPPGYLHAEGPRIADRDGGTVRLAGVNWYGFEGLPMVAGGLDLKTTDDICRMIVELGFNHIRLPYCDQMLLENPRIVSGLAANPGLAGARAVDILDEVVSAAGRQGLRVVLDNHRSTAGWSAQENGLWYSEAFLEADWLRSLRLVADHFKDDDTVIGIDLRNEPGSPAIDPNQFPANGGAVWGQPDRPWTRWPRDWAAAAERGGNEILEVNPNLLIFVEGVRGDPSGPIFGGQLQLYWPGGNLCGVAHKGGGRRAPRRIKLSMAERLVYSVHDYGPDMHPQMPWCQRNSTAETAAACRSVWDQAWGFIVQQRIAPVYVGEFGTPNGFRPGDDTAPHLFTDHDSSNNQGQWFSYLVDYMKEMQVSWAYWPLNGDQPAGVAGQAARPDWYGILRPDWSAPASAPLMAKLGELQGRPRCVS
jgi:endoglucanase